MLLFHLVILICDRVQSLTIRIIMFQIETEKVKCGKSTLQNTSRCEKPVRFPHRDYALLLLSHTHDNFCLSLSLSMFLSLYFIFCRSDSCEIMWGRKMRKVFYLLPMMKLKLITDNLENMRGNECWRRLKGI